MARRRHILCTSPGARSDLPKDRRELVDLGLASIRPDPLLHLLEMVPHRVERDGLVAGEDQRSNVWMGIGRAVRFVWIATRADIARHFREHGRD
jgi:hypothetical protein